MSPRLRKILYALFKHPNFKPETTHNAAKPHRLKRHFVMMRVHVGENGTVKTVEVKMSCGDTNIDQMAIIEVQNHPFTQPRVGHKAVAQWHNMRWEVPKDLR